MQQGRKEEKVEKESGDRGDVPLPKEGEPGHSLVPALEKIKLEENGEGDKVPPVGMGKLRRMDSETRDFDEFVDAES